MTLLMMTFWLIMKSVIDSGLVRLLTGESFLILSFESCHEKTCLLGFSTLTRCTGCCGLVSSVSASYASSHEMDPRVWHILSCKIYFALPLIQEELIVMFC